MNDGSENGVLGLLQRKPEPRGGLDIRRATQVFDAIPCNVFKPLKVHDFFIHAKSLFTSKQIPLIIRVAQLLRLDLDPERKGVVLLYPLLFR